MEISDRILQVMDHQHITSYQVWKDTNISESVFSHWRKCPTSRIKSETIIKLSKYLHVSCDYLLLGMEDDAHKNYREAVDLAGRYKDLIDAYKKAPKKARDIVRMTLDLPPEK